jgi:uncharacterized protein (TIGR02246 family)
MTAEISERRPALHITGAEADAAAAVAQFVQELQTGWDDHDAGVSNRRFAADVAWGSPFGATVSGYEELHAIHERLKQAGRGGPDARFQILRVLVPTPDVAVAQVRRQAVDDRGKPIEPTDGTNGAFSETALYVLVRRDDSWWLAAGQNTIIRPAPG